MLIGTNHGVDVLFPFIDTYEGRPTYVHYYDATHPEARQFIWDRCRENYWDKGVALFWLDACEPEISPLEHDNLRFHAGTGLEVANIYPLLHERGFHEGMTAAGAGGVINLCRSAWAGSQRYGAAVWSGDIMSDWQTLRGQVRAGLNIGMSGIPWWTTDIGGFHGGDPDDPAFRELLIRWFQYGVFCPLFRLHGVREPRRTEPFLSGADNEVWSYGEEAYTIIRDLLFLRERLRPYIMDQMKVASEKGIPPMRPLFFDYPGDSACYDIEDEFLFGPDILVAPVLESGARKRTVYLPADVNWSDAWTGTQVKSGESIEVDAPLDRIPVYLREGSKVALT
jgi:alpha-D-xyloside xylohydrolase